MRTIPAIIIAILLFCSGGLWAQNADDALLFSQTYYEGSARSMAMGNATGAMGGDVTAACINPAGLGLYRSQEFTFSTGLQHTFIGNQYYGNRESEWNSRMSIPNIGYVITMEWSNYKPLRYVQFAISMTRTNDFNQRSNAMGLNPNSSMIDAYLQTISGIDELHQPGNYPGTYLSENYPYDLDLAWETYLINQHQDNLGNYFFDSPIPQGNVYQKDYNVSKGRSEEWAMTTGANIKDKLFLGTSVGLTHIKRINTRTYSETPEDPLSDNNLFSSWTHTEELVDTAWGLNFKCGFIYFPTSWFRFGMAWHSRSLYAIGESWSTETASELINNPDAGHHQYYSPTLYQSYEFRTPQKLVGSATFFLGKRGCLNTDIEYVNYGASRFSSEAYSFSDTNDEIKNMLRPTFNFRLGTEWRLHQFFLRGGMAYYGSPYGLGKSNGSVRKLSVGIGYATSDISYWDFAYELTQTPSAYTPYRYYVDGENVVPDILQNKWRSKVVATLKIKIQ